jgi:hypothetical protein
MFTGVITHAPKEGEVIMSVFDWNSEIPKAQKLQK